MAETRRPGMSSAFDDLLAQSRKQLDDLYRGGQRRSGEAAAPAGPTLSTDRRSVATAAKPSSRLDASSSPAVRRLNERFGDDWRYEIAEQRREGDEAIVLCKLIFGKDGAARTQFGRAMISPGPVTGTSGDLRFRLNVGDTDQDERDAFRCAAEAALMNCIELI